MENENGVLQDEMTYMSPDIEVVGIELEGNILTGSGAVDAMPNELW